MTAGTHAWRARSGPAHAFLRRLPRLFAALFLVAAAHSIHGFHMIHGTLPKRRSVPNVTWKEAEPSTATAIRLHKSGSSGPGI